MPAISLIGSAYTERSKDLNAQTCVNLYPLMGGPKGKNVIALYGTPGLILRAFLGAEVIRGMHEFNDLLYVVAGDTLWELDTSFNKTSRGTLNTSTGRVSMADNGIAMMIVDGTNGYLFNDRTTPGTFVLEQITDADFPDGASQVVFLDGYFIFDKVDGNPGEFMISSLYAEQPAGGPPDDFDILDFATADSHPDSIVAMLAHNGHLYLLGESSTEVWYHSGEEFPFNPVGGARSERGCAAKWSVGHTPDMLLWLSQDHNGGKQVVMAAGFQFEPVSTPAVDFAIEGYDTISDAFGYCYTQEGHTFYVLTFPTENVTWVYDLTTGQWHRRAGWDTPTALYQRHRGNAYAHFAGKHLVGDFATGKIYELDLDTFDEDGDVLRAERTAPVVHDGQSRRRIRFHKLTIDMEVGVGDSTTLDPQLILDYSDDGGHVWKGERHLSIGAQGGYDARVIARRLGSSRQRNFRVVITDPVKRVLIGASLELEAGTS